MSLSFIFTAIGIFFVTDTDDLIVLLLLWLAAKTPQQRHSVIIGQYLGIITLMLVAWIISRGVVHFNVVHWTRWLGLIPLLLGTMGLRNWLRHRDTGGLKSLLTRAVSLPIVWSLTVGNGGDNLSIYIPYFSKLTLPAFGAVSLIFLIMIGGWLTISYYLAKSVPASYFFARFGAWLSPILFIIVGLAILL